MLRSIVQTNYDFMKTVPFAIHIFGFQEAFKYFIMYRIYSFKIWLFHILYEMSLMVCLCLLENVSFQVLTTHN
jgi:hypothetical protein